MRMSLFQNVFLYQPLNCNIIDIIIQHIYYIVYLSHIVGHQNKKRRNSSLVQRSGRNSRSWSFSNINEEYEKIYNSQISCI